MPSLRMVSPASACRCSGRNTISTRSCTNSQSLSSRPGLGTQLTSFRNRAHDESEPSLQLAIPDKASLLARSTAGRDQSLVPLGGIERAYRQTSPLVRPDARFYYDPAVAPAIAANCSDRSFAYDSQNERFDPLFHAAFYGLPAPSHESLDDVRRHKAALPGFPSQGILEVSDPTQLPLPSMQVPQLQKLILDSGKLAKLDALLTKLKAEGHRCLIYFQMTRMIDLFEEYLAFRQHKYLRLDGNSTISERRDMVTDWQTKPELFIFLLSTRAGGLGINLTAADTVIFYDSDWNPSVSTRFTRRVLLASHLTLVLLSERRSSYGSSPSTRSDEAGHRVSAHHQRYGR